MKSWCLSRLLTQQKHRKGKTWMMNASCWPPNPLFILAGLLRPHVRPGTIPFRWTTTALLIGEQSLFAIFEFTRFLVASWTRNIFTGKISGTSKQPLLRSSSQSSCFSVRLQTVTRKRDREMASYFKNLCSIEAKAISVLGVGGYVPPSDVARLEDDTFFCLSTT